MWTGIEFRKELGPEEGYNPPLPGIETLLRRAYSGNVVTEQDLARAYENCWQQVAVLNLASERLTAMAIEFANQNADIIQLNECALICNNLPDNPDGTTREFMDWQLQNGYYGKETSPEESRKYDFAEMIVQRLKDNHGQEFEIINRQITDGVSGKKTLDTLENVNGVFQWMLTNVILVRKSLKACVLRSFQKEFKYARVYRPFEIVAGADPEGTEKVTIDFGFGVRRGYMTNDLKIKGVKFRIIGTHFASGNNISGIPPALNAESTKYRSVGPAKASQALEILTNEIQTTKLPVVLLGDFNSQSLNEQAGSEFLFGIGIWETLVSSVTPDGQPTNSGGVMIDTVEEVFPGQGGSPQFKTADRGNFSLTDPNLVYNFRIDHILIKRDSGIRAVEYGMTQPGPLPQSPSQPFAFTSDHNGVFARLRIKKH
jgi:hypothetical protein